MNVYWNWWRCGGCWRGWRSVRRRLKHACVPTTTPTTPIVLLPMHISAPAVEERDVTSVAMVLAMPMPVPVPVPVSVPMPLDTFTSTVIVVPHSKHRHLQTAVGKRASISTLLLSLLLLLLLLVVVVVVVVLLLLTVVVMGTLSILFEYLLCCQ